MAILTISTSRDYTGDLLFNIAIMDFTGAASAMFAGGQFNNVNIRKAPHVDGSAGANEIIVNSDFRGFDASGWTFGSWGLTDRLIIRGSDFGERLTGSARRDTITGGNGSDTIRGLGGADIIEGGAGADQLKGGAGGDTLSYASSPAAVRVDLNSGTALGGDATGDRFSGLEHLQGSSHDDTLSGDSGSNRIEGGGGADILRGRAGADAFIYTTISNSLAEGSVDLIRDFSRAEGDRIDVSAIDAVAGGGNDAFAFIGDAPFTTAGQLRSTIKGLHTLIEADVTGDGTADLAILLSGRVALTAADFIL